METIRKNLLISLGIASLAFLVITGISFAQVDEEECTPEICGEDVEEVEFCSDDIWCWYNDSAGAKKWKLQKDCPDVKEGPDDEDLQCSGSSAPPTQTPPPSPQPTPPPPAPTPPPPPPPAPLPPQEPPEETNADSDDEVSSADLIKKIREREAAKRAAELAKKKTAEETAGKTGQTVETIEEEVENEEVELSRADLLKKLRAIEAAKKQAEESQEEEENNDSAAALRQRLKALEAERKKAREAVQKTIEEEIKQEAEQDAKQFDIDLNNTAQEITDDKIIAENIQTTLDEHITDTVLDTNQDSISDRLDPSAAMVNQIIEIRAQGELLLDEGIPQDEVNQQINQQVAEVKFAAYKQAAKQQYNIVTQSNRDDNDSDGMGSTFEMQIGANPKIAEATEEGDLVQRDEIRGGQQIYNGFRPLKRRDLKKVTLNLQPGSKLSKKAAVLARCASGKSYNITATKKKNSYRVGKAVCGQNNKFVAVADLKKLQKGKYAIRVERDRSAFSFWPASFLFASAVDSDKTGDEGAETITEDSDYIPVEIVDDTELSEPVVESIQDIEVAGVKNIEVTPTGDGRVKVTGSTDFDSAVIGTFSSAVFTSAMLADVETGAFELVSPKPLEKGDHEVVIYSTRPEKAVQSTPVKIKFRIVETANAASEEPVVIGGWDSVPPTRPAAEKTGFPMTGVAAGAGVLIVLVGIGIFLKKKKNPTV